MRPNSRQAKGRATRPTAVSPFAPQQARRTRSPVPNLPQRARRRRRPAWVFGPSWASAAPYVFEPVPEPPFPSRQGAVPPAAPAVEGRPPEAADDTAAAAADDGAAVDDGAAAAADDGAAAAADDGAAASNDAPAAQAGELRDTRPAQRARPPAPVRGGSATLLWSECNITRFPVTELPVGGGIYIVRGSGDAPLYVGTADNFALRWHKRLREAYQAGVIPNDFRGSPVRLWLGKVHGNVSEDTRKTLEWAIYRTLLHGALGGRLRNESSISHRVPAFAIQIHNVLPAALKRRLRLPAAMSSTTSRQAIRGVLDTNTLHVAAQTVFELELHEPARASGLPSSALELESALAPEAFDWAELLRRVTTVPRQGPWGYPFDLAELDGYYTPAERAQARAAGVSASNVDPESDYRSLLGLVYRRNFGGHFPLYKTRPDWHGAVDIPVPAAAVGKFLVRSIGDGVVLGATIDTSYSGMANGGVIVVVKYSLPDGRSFLARYVHLHNLLCTQLSDSDRSRVPPWDTYTKWSASRQQEWMTWLKKSSRTLPLREGTRVRRGQALGPLGYLLRGHHLHFEIISRDAFPGFAPVASRTALVAQGSVAANRFLSVHGDTGAAYWGPNHDSRNWTWYHPLHFLQRLNGGTLALEANGTAKPRAPAGSVTTRTTTGVAAPAPTPASATTSPARFKQVKSGYAAYGGGDVGAFLRELRRTSKLSVTDDDIDVLRRIAAVETGGQLTGINSYDSAVLSVGFMQWTLRYSELGEWIRGAEGAFRQHGIELDAGRNYNLGDDRPAAIRGAARADDLRSYAWAQRFYEASIDPAIVVVEVRQALDTHLPRQKNRVALRVNAQVKGGWALIESYYQRSSLVRALLHETYNNRPVCAHAAAITIAKKLAQGGRLDDTAFLTGFKQAIVDAYSGRGESDKGVRLTSKVTGLARG